MNPFDISFSKSPVENIERYAQIQTVIDAFTADTITNQLFLLTGVRGAGKTVLMNQIANRLEKDRDWIVVRLNPEMNLLQSLGAKLSDNSFCSGLFRKAKIGVSVFGISLEISDTAQNPNLELTVEKMLKAIKKSGKRLLITIDEVMNSPQIRVFAASFQIFLGQELPVFLLMTGLYENVEDLKNEKNMTFLYRAPRIEMTPLNLDMIATRYMDIFNLEADEARHMANLTKGYPFAFQALGFARWNNKDDPESTMAEYRLLLEDFVYEKIWSELSSKDKYILNGIANCKDGRLNQINDYLGLKKDEINPYRKRLIKKGLVDGSEHGILRLKLPLFDIFIVSKYTD